MPSLKATRNRITSVKNTRKITRALKLVSTAKLRRAQEALIAARPYASAITKVVSELSAVTEVSLRIIGRKGNQYFARRRATVTSFDGAPTGATALDLARETANRVISDFTLGKVDRVYVVYNEFKSAISQVTRVKQLLPVVPEKVTALVPAGHGAPAGHAAQ